MRNPWVAIPFLIIAFVAVADDMSDAEEMLARGQAKEAIELMEAVATRNDVNAAYRVGVIYRDGEGVAPDPARALEWFTLAAEPDWMRDRGKQGSPEAQYALGRMYRDGVGTDRDPEEAAEWFELAAEQGHGHAAMVLGELLLRGEGVDRDYVEAFVWSSIAADRLSGEDEQQATAIRQAAKDQLSAAEHDEARRRIADLAQ